MQDRRWQALALAVAVLAVGGPATADDARAAAPRTARRLRQLPLVSCSGNIWSASALKVCTAEAVGWVDASREMLRIGLASGAEIQADALVLATDPATVRRLAVESGLADEPWRERVAATCNAPPFAVWRLWLDRPVASDRAAFLGTSGFGPLDNISVLERFEESARRWAAAHGGSVVELHAYALTEQSDRPVLKNRLLAELRRIYPELEPATIVAEEWLVNDDCPLWGTDPWEQRPTVRTPDPRIVLAGDGIRCGFPVALMDAPQQLAS